jgi:hypothetical protein
MTDVIGEQATTWRHRMLHRDHLADLGFAAVLLALLWLVYAPSLEHTPRSDQWCFLLDTIDQHKFWDIFAHSYSYNRTRRIGPGDTDLYRPLLFAVLAAEKACFADDFAAYQVFGILLHWGLTCLLLLLLRTISAFAAGTIGSDSSPSTPWVSLLLPYGVCLFFALNKSVQELVIWSHLHGYLLFLIFLLASLTLLLYCARRPASWKSALLWGSWILALLTAFTYEIGQCYAVLAGVFLAAALPSGTGRGKRLAICGLFAAVLALYQGADRLDRWIHREQFSPEDVRTQIKEQAFSKGTLAHSKRFLAYTVAQPFFPSLWVGTFNIDRVNMREVEWSREHFRHFSPALLTSTLTAAVATGLGLFGLVRLILQRDKLSVLMVFLTLGLYGVYMAATVLGRMNIRPGPDCLSTNCYYAYMGLLLALAPIGTLWQSVGRGRVAAASQFALLLGLIALAGYSAPDVWRLNESVARDLRQFREPIAAVRTLIERYIDEADFSLAFDLDSCQAISTVHGVPIRTIVFKRYLNPSSPKYVMHSTDGKPTMMRYDEWQASQSPRGRLCPELVTIDTFYNYYHVDGWYYGVLHRDGCFDPSRRDYAYLVKAPTLEEAQRQKWAKLAEQDADVRSGRLIPQNAEIVLLEESYQGFNLIGTAGKVYAIPQGEGPFELSKFRQHGYSRSYTGRNITEVKSQIDTSARP